MNDIMKITKYLEESGLLIKGVSEAIRNEAKEQKGVLLGTLGASLLGNLFTGKGVIAMNQGRGRAGEQVKVLLDQARIFNAVSSQGRIQD